MILAFMESIERKLGEIKREELAQMQQAGRWIAEAVAQGGVVHLFGCGHSHLLAEDVFYRAGGLAPIHPILVEKLMLHEGAARSSELERQHGLAETFMEEQAIQPGDVVIVISTSGINPVPIEVALLAKEKGAKVIGLTSLAYASGVPSRHQSGRHLSEVVDMVLNNHVDQGDALLSHERVPAKFGPSSTILGSLILQSVLVEAVGLMADAGVEVPVFRSGNIPGADDYNKALVEKYASKIPTLK
ncbi:putative phosphosugar-binding protein [Laceyella sacchari]|uniref:SIS domain-containing protein n=1 Tax=Laceyella sacchari TaxID=37482 RepID=UPI001051428F|nr:SIS domain-containing protein [Laceyella sacchari]TCW41519.1 putative phosphosugar-binding protein [Laceyella sacchari]